MNLGRNLSGCVVLLSGGLDSLVTAVVCAKQFNRIQALFVNYGQIAAERELSAARQQCAKLSIPLEVIELPFVAQWASGPLISGAGIPKPVELDESTARASARAVWIPARNGLFAAIGVCLAESRGFEAVAMGLNAEEGATFRDNSPEFVSATGAFFGYATMQKIAFVAPLSGLDKAAIVALGLKEGAPLEAVWSCYGPGPSACGECESCVRLGRAMKANGITAFANHAGETHE
jgi:7-cyano-7-deazaguanine synthase